MQGIVTGEHDAILLLQAGIQTRTALTQPAIVALKNFYLGQGLSMIQ